MWRLLSTLIVMGLITAAHAQTYAIPDGNGGYTYLDAGTTQTVRIGSLALPPPWLRLASPAQMAALGIVPVVQTPQPDPATNSIVGSSIQVRNGVPTVVWSSTPILPPPPPTPAQQAQGLYNAAVATGLTVTCAPAATVCTPAIVGTYAVDHEDWTVVSGIATGITANLGLPGNGASFSYSDMTGNGHTFTAPQFLEFAQALRDYAYALLQAEKQAIQGGSPVWPSPHVALQ